MAVDNPGSVVQFLNDLIIQLPAIIAAAGALLAAWRSQKAVGISQENKQAINENRNAVVEQSILTRAATDSLKQAENVFESQIHRITSIAGEEAQELVRQLVDRTRIKAQEEAADKIAKLEQEVKTLKRVSIDSRSRLKTIEDSQVIPVVKTESPKDFQQESDAHDRPDA